MCLIPLKHSGSFNNKLCSTFFFESHLKIHLNFPEWNLLVFVFFTLDRISLHFDAISWKSEKDAHTHTHRGKPSSITVVKPQLKAIKLTCSSHYNISKTNQIVQCLLFSVSHSIASDTRDFEFDVRRQMHQHKLNVSI